MVNGSGTKKTSIFDKLTDTSQYTGSHQHRFDNNGKGRGLAGRDRIAKGSGTTDTPYDDGTPIRDLSQITRTNLRSKDAKAPARPKSSKQVQEAKQHRCREKNCVNSCSPTSKQGFCSYHMWQENESASYPKNDKAAAEPSSSPEPINRRHQRSTSSLCQVPQCGNDRGPDGFCLVHASSAKDGSAAKPEAIKEDHDEAQQASERRCVIQSCEVAIYRMGYCRAHFQEMQSLEDDHAEDKQASAGSSPTTRQAKGNAKAAGKTLSRLTDPKLYTGSHQHRFDKNGNGVGLDGRDSVAKGSGTAAKYHGGKINDISQVLRQG